MQTRPSCGCPPSRWRAAAAPTRWRSYGEAYYVYLPAPAYYVRELSLLIFRPPPPLDVVKRHAERGRPDA